MKHLRFTYFTSFFLLFFLRFVGSSSAQTTIVLPQACNCPTGVAPSTNGGAVVSNYGNSICTNPSSGTINGGLTEGVVASWVTMTLYANVTTVGSWNISTVANNGVSFSGSGTFTSLGCQPITLTASGTPTSSGTLTVNTNTTPVGTASTTVAASTKPSSNGTAEISAITCNTASAGTMMVGTAVSGVSQTITATVISVGTYNISTTANGVVFAGSGTFTGTGTQDIILTASGTPISALASPYIYTLNTTPNCSFSRIVITVSQNVLTQIGNEGDSPNTIPSVVTVAQINTITPVIIGALLENETAYQVYIDANPNLFSSPATAAEVQAMINAVNTSQSVLTQIGNEGDSPNTIPSVVTVAQINAISPAIIGALLINEAAYQVYIDTHPNLFSSPATATEVQAMITAVNASQSVLAQIGNEGDSPNTVPSIVTVAQINTISPAIIGALLVNETAYQAYIDVYPNLFSSPATAAEVQAMITAVNQVQSLIVATPTYQGLSVLNTTGVGYNGEVVPNSSTITIKLTNSSSEAVPYTLTATDAVTGLVYSNSGTIAANATDVDVVLTPNTVVIPELVSGLLSMPLIGASNSIILAPRIDVKSIAASATIIIDVVLGTQTWMDRNLGARRAATAKDDIFSLGNHYQWGRPADGHEISVSDGSNLTNAVGRGFNDPTALEALATSDIPANGNFVKTFVTPFDWRNDNNNNRWATAAQGPCPTGYHVPNNEEWKIADAFGVWNNSTDTYNSTLKLPGAGYQYGADGVCYDHRDTGFYWASNISATVSTKSNFMSFNFSSATPGSNTRANGFSVRCLKDNPASASVLGQIGNEGDSPNTVPSIVTVAQINTITPAITGALLVNETFYQAYIDANPNLFASPATAAEVQAMVTSVNQFQALTVASATYQGLSVINPTGVGYNGEAVPSTSTITVKLTNSLNVALPYTLTATDAVSGLVYSNSGTIVANATNVDVVLTPNTVVMPAFTSGLLSMPLMGASNSITLTPRIDVKSLAASATTVIDVVIGTQTWMDRNLGARRAATAFDDVFSLGNHYQWGRPADGHEITVSDGTSLSVNTGRGFIDATALEDLATSDIPGNGNFIKTDVLPKDWRSDNNNNRWANAAQGPCPISYHVPNNAEWNTADAFGAWNSRTDTYNSTLKLPSAGYRDPKAGVIYYHRDRGYYWASDVSTTNSNYMFFSTVALTGNQTRANGFSVRCLKDNPASSSVLGQIGNEGDSPNTVPSIVTVAQINTISPAITDVINANEVGYQVYIDANPTLFASPATAAEVQAMVTAVNTAVPTSNGTGLVSAYSCSTASAGTMTVGTAVSGVTQTITATVTTVGTYSISTTANGVTFVKTDTFAGTGAQTIVLTATGTPTAVGNSSFILNTSPGCTFTRAVASNVPNNAIGVGSLSGKTCFDVALSNDNTNSCSALTGRTAQQANFSQAATNTQVYTFTPSGTISNVRFVYVNTNGTAISAISGNNTSNNISTAVNATVTYTNTLNTSATGLTASNAITSDIYVIYNNSANNSGVDQQIKLTANIKDCSCCGVMVSPTVYKEFLCYNLGANTSVDPNVPSVGIQGAHIQWGKRGPNTTGDARADWQTATNNAALGFAAAPTVANLGNGGAISGWITSGAANNSWRTVAGLKTANDPCPSGYRVPTVAEWSGVIANNTATRTGTFVSGTTQYGSALHFGPNASSKVLTLPASGYRFDQTGELQLRGTHGIHWASTSTDNTNGDTINFTTNTLSVSVVSKPAGIPVRCIKE